MSPDQINKKLDRRVVYHEDGSRSLLEHSTGRVIDANATSEIAHRWLHGKERHDDPPTVAPTFDEMEAVIASKLTEEMGAYMNWALDHPEQMQAMYNAAKAERRLVRACW